MMSEKNIYQRINAIMSECDYIKKESAGMGKGVKYDDVIAMIRPLLIKHGVVMRVEELGFVNLGDLAIGKQRLFEGKYRLDLINIDKPDDLMSQTSTGQGMDTGDKAPGKAQTYAVKVMLVKGFSLETGEDEESRAEKMDTQNVIDEAQYGQLEALLTETVDGEVQWTKTHLKVLAAYKISNLRMLPESKFKDAKKRLENANN